MNQHIRRIFVLLTLSAILSPAFLAAQPVVSMEDSPHFVADQSIHQFNIRIDDLTELYAFSIELSYDPNAITVSGVFSYDFLSTSSTTGSRTVSYHDYSTAGKIIMDEAILGVTPETTSGGVLFTVFYRAAQFGVQKEVPIEFDVCLLRDEYNNPISRIVHDGMIYLWYGRARVKVFLQGPYDANTGGMHTLLRDADYAAQRQSPFAQDTMTFPSQLPAGVVDWVLVEVRQGTTGAIIYSKSCFLLTDGSVVAPSIGASADIPLKVPVGNYSLIVRHRNHLSIQTSVLYAVGTGIPSTYDFSSGQSSAYGNNAMVALGSGSPSPYGMYAGDASGEGIVRYNGFQNDRAAILVQVGLTTPNNIIVLFSNNDVNMDAVVRYNGIRNDRAVVLVNVGLATPNNIIQTQVP